MWNPVQFKNYCPSFRVLVLGPLFLLLTSCMPSQSPGVNTGKSTTGSGAPNTTLYQEPTFPMSGTFIQEGASRTSSNFPLPVNFSDSFLVRGNTLSKYLRKLPNTTKFCMVGKYNHVPGTDKFLVLAAKPKSFTDLISKTTEFYLQVEPANDQANQNDCLTYNLSNALFSGASSPSLSFGLNQLCTTCSTAVTSTPLKLYFNNGEEISTVGMGTLLMTIAGNSTNSSNSCVESSACKSRGFDCCLGGQCAKDGAVRPSAIFDANFMSAQEDVRVNPERFIVYPQFYFVCETRPEGPSNGNGGNSGNDPNYEAAVRIMEYSQLYQCLNQVDGEFSYCTVKFGEASKNIPGNFSAASGGKTDDVNFSTLNPNFSSGNYVNNIVKVLYGGKVLYELNKTPLTDASFVAGTANDGLSTAQSVNVTSALPSNAQDDNLYLTYKVDGTCDKVGTSLARCTKTYIHASSDTTLTTWHDTGKFYALPSYADISASLSLVVKIGGLIIAEDSSTWSRTASPKGVTFAGSYSIFQNQKVEITYFVTSGIDTLFASKTLAQGAVNTMCVCAANAKCNLKPVYNESQALVNYDCAYPSTTTETEAPANQTVYVSNKNVPHRYYDVNGVSYDADFGSALNQEGTAFSYTNNDVLKPNNHSQYIGFNEIYGSFAKTGTYLPKPAKQARVKKDKLYDILVTAGGYSSCATCGTDYYSAIQKIFPQNFQGVGGGYTPDYFESRRESNATIYRSDDLLYGRACFVPATMIPWTHVTATDPKDQRRGRLAAQHFLHANGYNRDWYGFDYGSVIGSFDGVNWFSIGNQRRIKASSNKLYLAVNAYYGDLAVDNNFTVTVSESSSFSSTIPAHDTETDGAECQRAHYCSTDRDCFANLGYDYTCQNVSGLMTNWPQFDGNGSEVVGSVNKSIASIVSGTNGQAKRCVYRGRGAPCSTNLASTSTFNSSTVVGTLACSPNNYCLGTNQTGFNDKINRYASSPTVQNLAGLHTPASDTVGLGAKIIGRPFDYFGNKSVPSSALPALNSNLVNAICVPGKDLANSTTTDNLNSRVPSSRPDTSDKILGVGTTLSGASENANLLAACPAVNTAGVAVHLLSGTALGSSTITDPTRTQNLSVNLLNIPAISPKIYSSTGTTKVEAIGYQKNACLRTAGNSCFSDMDCGPSTFLSTKFKSSDMSSLNEAERKFWEEDLVCGNPEYKLVDGGLKNPLFDVKKNRCCREFGKTTNVYTETDSSAWQWCEGTSIRMAGVNAPLISSVRYSKVHTAYDKITCDPALPDNKTYAMSIKATNASTRYDQIRFQFKTLDTVNQRTCCTQHWVRSFDATNGGGHNFSKAKSQTYNLEMFKHINWNPQNHTVIAPATDPAFYCLDDGVNHTTSACEVRSFSDADAEKYLQFAASLELIGIPQVAVMTNDQIYKNVDDNQLAASVIGGGDPNFPPLSHTISSVGTTDGDFKDSSGFKYYSAANYSKFDMSVTGKLKKVFSESEFNCCVPSGAQVPETVNASQCCTGFVANLNGPRRCCLPDFTDVTVYLNRYVSSEGRGLPDNSYDEKTGYIKDAGVVHQMAAAKNLCCSGRTVIGVALNDLSIPIVGDRALARSPLTVTRRFIYRSDIVDNNSGTHNAFSYFDVGLKWKNHVYCVPTDFDFPDDFN